MMGKFTLLDATKDRVHLYHIVETAKGRFFHLFLSCLSNLLTLKLDYITLSDHSNFFTLGLGVYKTNNLSNMAESNLWGILSMLLK